MTSEASYLEDESSEPLSPMAVDDSISRSSPVRVKRVAETDEEDEELLDDGDEEEENENEEEGADATEALTAPPFDVNERVYCKDNQQSQSYYEAIIRESAWNESERRWTFLVHYAGWNSRWDRWVSAETCLKDTEQTRRLVAVQQQQQQQQQKPEETSASAATAAAKRKKPETDSAPSTNTKRRNTGLSSARQQQQPLLYSDYCELPLTLKTVLAEEFERIAQRRGWDAPFQFDCQPADKPPRLVHALPAAVSVRKVINHFCSKKLQAVKKSGSGSNVPSSSTRQQETAQQQGPTQQQPTAEQVQSFCDGLLQLFEDALPVYLLYAQERPQYELLLEKKKMQAEGGGSTSSNPDKKKRLADMYGCEYLLRLYVRLPVLLQETEDSDARVVGPLLTELLVLMQKNRQALFKDTSYREPTTEEWMDWERKLHKRHQQESATMDTR